MAVEKFVEDSDEEDDEPQSSPPSVASVLTDLSPDNVTDLQRPLAAPHANPFQILNPSTLSAKLIANGITPSMEPVSLSQQPLPSPSMSKGKMKRALSSAEDRSPRCHKAGRTTSSEFGREAFRYCGNSDGEVEMTSKAVRNKEREAQSKNRVDTGVIDSIGIYPCLPKPGDQVNLSSSTTGYPIVNITPAKAASSRGTTASWSSIEAPPSAHDSSMNGSMPPPTIWSRERSDNNITSPEDQAQVNLHSSAIAALQTLPSSDSKQDCSSRSSRMSRGNMTRVEEATADQANANTEDLEDELSRTSPIFQRRSTISPIVLLQQGTRDNSKIDSAEEASRLAEDISNGFDSDDNAIGMPKEQYRPRPSRSRAGFDATGLIAPVDFSKKPESVAKTTVRPKRKNKRSKTTSFQELRPPNHETEDDEDDLVKAEVKLEIPIWKDHSPKSQLDDADFGNEIDSRSIAFEKGTSMEMEKAAQQPKKQRGRPKKMTVIEGDERASKAAKGVSKEGVPISNPVSSRGAKQTGRMAMTVELQAERVNEGEEKEEEQRISHCNSDDESNPKENVSTSNNNVLEESTGNTANPISPSTETTKPPPETPKKRTETPADKKGPDKHSPINSGNKVAYRVGLSKRARIEPLLRIVRK